MKRTAVIGTVVASLAAITSFFYNGTSYMGLYQNKISSWITTPAGRQKEAEWVKKNFNSVSIYGVDGSYLSSATNRANVRDYILRLRRLGIKEVGYVYSSASFSYLDTYMKESTDSSRFNVLLSEIEQYNTGDRVGFAKNLSAARDYAVKNNMKSKCYQGWPTQADCDTIAKYCDGVELHAYGQYDKYSNVGSWCYGYCKTRLGMFDVSFSKVGKVGEFHLLVSTENPDQTKTQFGYKYFLTHAIGSCYTSFAAYAPKYKNINYVGQQTFVEDQYKVINP